MEASRGPGFQDWNISVFIWEESEFVVTARGRASPIEENWSWVVGAPMRTWGRRSCSIVLGLPQVLLRFSTGL